MRSSLPHLIEAGADRRLVIDDRPTILLGGQVHNSTSSSARHFEAAAKKLRSLNLSTALTPVTWELLEPEEGRFDFTGVDDLLRIAGEHDLRLVLLWFGAFKNAASTYAPRWVRADRTRFPRASTGDEKLRLNPFETEARPTLSVFSPALREADRTAFAALLAHLAEVDLEHTVVMVQVENEIGLLGAARDHCGLAEAAWADAVPSKLIDYLTANRERLAPALAVVWAGNGNRTSANWEQVFGDDWRAAEVFMAWHFAVYVDELAVAGKQAHPLPMYVNAWLGPQPGQEQAGEYPSGGPTENVLDVWKAAAPAIDFLSPDIYTDRAAEVLATYARPDNPLFVPESLFSAASLVLALGRHHGLGYSVFGAEDGRVGNQFSAVCELLAPMAAEIAAAQSEGRIAAVVVDEPESEVKLTLGGYTLTIRDARHQLRRALLDMGVPAPPEITELPWETEGHAVMAKRADARPFGLVLHQDDDSFLVVGTGLNFTFEDSDGSVEIDRIEEGRYVDGQWVRGRVLNGDERLQPVPLDQVGASRLTVLRFDERTDR